MIVVPILRSQIINDRQGKMLSIDGSDRQLNITDGVGVGFKNCFGSTNLVEQLSFLTYGIDSSLCNRFTLCRTVMLSWRSEPSVLDILPWRSLMIGDRIMGTMITDDCILLYLRPSFALSTSKCFHISLFLFFLSFLMDCNVQIAATNVIKCWHSARLKIYHSTT